MGLLRSGLGSFFLGGMAFLFPSLFDGLLEAGDPFREFWLPMRDVSFLKAISPANTVSEFWFYYQLKFVITYCSV